MAEQRGDRQRQQQSGQPAQYADAKRFDDKYHAHIHTGSANRPHHADLARPLQHIDPHRASQAQRADNCQQHRHDHQKGGDNVKLRANPLFGLPYDIHVLHFQAVAFQMLLHGSAQRALRLRIFGFGDNLHRPGPACFRNGRTQPGIRRIGERPGQRALGNADHRKLQPAVTDLDRRRAAYFQFWPVFYHFRVHDQRILIFRQQPTSTDQSRFDHCRANRRGHQKHIFTGLIFRRLAGILQYPARSEAPGFRRFHARHPHDFLFDPGRTETLRKADADIVMKIVHRFIQRRIQ